MPKFPPFCLIFAIFCVVVSEVAGARGDGIVEDESSTSRALPGSQTANSETHHAGTNTPFQNSPIPGTVAVTTAQSRLTQEADHILSTAQNAQSSSPSSSSTHNPHHEFRSRLPEISKILLSFQQRDLWSNEYNGLMTTPSHDSSEGEGERETASRPSHNSLQRTLQTEAVDQHHTSVDTVTPALELTQRTTLSRMADQQSVAEASTQPDNEVTQFTTVSGSEILLNSDAADTARSSSHHHAETPEPATQLTGTSSELVVEPTQTSSPSQLTTQHITGQSGSTNQQSTNTAYLTSPWQQTMQNSSSSAPTQQLITDTPSVETTSHARHTEASDLAMPSSPSVVDESTTSQHRMRNTAAPKFTARPRNDTIDIVQPTAVPEFAVRPRNDTIDVTPPLHESEVTTAMSGFADENSTRVDKTQKSQSTIHLNTPLSSSTAKPQGFVEINNETDTYSSSERVYQNISRNGV
ncbi:uncharacterized protein [Ptychodera flava]|uniref:uncharacterized protein n=1 Tax=Ptychodera flava TaxID=63121 RepID=UPI00396A24D9